MTKIAFWRTIGDSFRFVFNDLGRFFQTAGIWIIAILALELLAATFIPSSPGSLAIFAVVHVVAYLIGLVACSVAWLRALLSEETSSTTVALRFGSREWRFVGYALLIALVISVPMLIFSFVAGIFMGGIIAMSGGSVASAGSSVIAARMIVVVLALVAWYVMSRFSLALVSVAVDQHGDLLSAAWRRSRRNGIRLMFGPAVCSLPFAIVSMLIQKFVSVPLSHSVLYPVYDTSASSLALPMVATALIFTISFIQIALWAAFLAFSYRQLGGPGAAPSSGMMDPHLVPAE